MEEAVPLSLMTGSLCGLWWVLVVVQLAFTLAIAAVSMAGFVAWIWMIVDVIQRDPGTFKTENDRLVWILVVILAGWIGALIYYLVEYRRYKGLNKDKLL